MAHGVLAHECVRHSRVTTHESRLSFAHIICCFQVHARVLVQQPLPHAPLHGRRGHLRARVCSVISPHSRVILNSSIAPVSFSSVTSAAPRCNLHRTACRCHPHPTITTRRNACIDVTKSIKNRPQCMWRNTNPVYGGGFRAANAGLQVRKFLNPVTFLHSHRHRIAALFRHAVAAVEYCVHDGFIRGRQRALCCSANRRPSLCCGWHVSDDACTS